MEKPTTQNDEEMKLNIKHRRFLHVLSMMVCQPSPSVAEQHRRERLISDGEFADIYAEMVDDFIKKHTDNAP